MRFLPFTVCKITESLVYPRDEWDRCGTYLLTSVRFIPTCEVWEQHPWDTTWNRFAAFLICHCAVRLVRYRGNGELGTSVNLVVPWLQQCNSTYVHVFTGEQISIWSQTPSVLGWGFIAPLGWACPPSTKPKQCLDSLTPLWCLFC